MTSGRAPSLTCWNLNRWEVDFTDTELSLLTQLQGPLCALQRASAVPLIEPDQHAVEACLRAGLTVREREVLELLAAGLTATAVGHRLRVSPRTVHKHLEHVYTKLGCHDRLLAVSRARSLGILPKGDAGSGRPPPQPTARVGGER